MADSSNILNRPFGLNIKVPERTIQQAQETAGSAVSNLWTPLFSYLDENNNVFTGDVAREIDKYNRMAYSLGSIVRQGKPEITFDTKG